MFFVVRSSLSPEAVYVFKGVDFSAFLENRILFPPLRDTFYHEIQIISSLPKHPNILPPSNTFVIVSKIGDD